MDGVLILQSSYFWQTMFSQLGVSCGLWDKSATDDQRKVKLMIINKQLKAKQIADIKKLLPADMIYIYDIDITENYRVLSAKKPYYFNDDEYWFEQKILVREKASALGAREYLFPLKIDFRFTGKAKRKQFYDRRKELASEIVGEIAEGEILRFVNNYLHTICAQNSLHIKHYSFVPENKPLFIFRIDTDFANYKEIKNLYNICRYHGIKGSWFCDVFNEDTLKLYSEFEDQEIGLHCDKHYVYSSKLENAENINRALAKLNKYNLHPTGFAAPFGAWNRELEAALIEAGITYSSEFAFAYDSVPLKRNTAEGSILQIPIHPVSSGRLRRSHYSEIECVNYYKNYILSRVAMGMPAIIYYHPGHKMNTMLKDIFEWVGSNGYNNMTMLDYAQWWLQRDKIPDISDNNTIIEEDLRQIRIAYPEDYARKYQRNWRWFLYEYEAAKSRKHFCRYGYPRHLI